MSKQLAISAAFATFAMAVFAVTNGPTANYAGMEMETGAATQVTAPAVDRVAPILSGLIR